MTILLTISSCLLTGLLLYCSRLELPLGLEPPHVTPDKSSSSSDKMPPVQEDVAIMQWINGKMILSCGAVVSPLAWSGSQKIGMDLAGIHDPVPHFNEGPALKFVSKIFEKGLRAGVPLARANWFIMDTGEHSLVSMGRT